MTDLEAIQIYNDNNKCARWKNKTVEKRLPEFYDYITHRFKDTTGTELVSELMYRIEHKLEEHPKCIVCGKPLTYLKNYRRYTSAFCSKTCFNTKQGKLYQTEKMLETKLIRYGTTSYNNREKFKNTLKERYNVENICEIPGVIEKATEHMKQTNMKRYGHYWSNNCAKGNQTKLERYGDANYNNIEKMKETKKEKYGDCYFNNHAKTIQTNIDKYGCENPMQNELIKQYALHIKEEKYNDPTFNNHAKSIQTNIDRYGCENPMLVEEIKNKSVQTKLDNNSFGKSKIEDDVYEIISNKYDNVYRNHKTNKYPYCCDLYFKDYDIYIELNLFWTHGEHPFNENNINDIEKLNKWKELSVNSDFYRSAIITWTKSDVNKRTCAKNNNLKYFEIYENDLKIIIDTIEKIIKDNK